MFVVHHNQKNDATDSVRPNTRAWLRGTVARASARRSVRFIFLSMSASATQLSVLAPRPRAATHEGVEDQQRIHRAAVREQHGRNRGDEQQLDDARLRQSHITQQRGAQSVRPRVRRIADEVAFAHPHATNSFSRRTRSGRDVYYTRW